MKGAVDGTEAIRKWEYHMWDRRRLEHEYKTNFDSGLDENTASQLLREVGNNQLTEKNKTPACILFLKEQTGFFSLLLWFGSLLCFIAYGIQENSND